MQLSEASTHGTVSANYSTRFRPVIRRNKDWTLKEHEIIVSHWPDVQAIRKFLPHRTERAIRAFAGKCNLTSSRHVWTAAMETKLRKMAAAGYRRKEIAEELGLGVSQVASRMQYTGITLARRPPAPSADPLVDAIRKRAFELDISLIDLDRSLGNRKIFQQSSGRQAVSHVHIKRAVEALGGRLVVEWCDE